MKKGIKSLGFVVAFLLVAIIATSLFNVQPKVEKAVYSDLIKEIEDGKISELVLKDSEVKITYNKNKEAKIPGNYFVGNEIVLEKIKAGAIKIVTNENATEYTDKAFLDAVKTGKVAEIIIMGDKVAYTNKNNEIRFTDIPSEDLLKNKSVRDAFNAGAFKISSSGTVLEESKVLEYAGIVEKIAQGNVTELVITDDKVLYTNKDNLTRITDIAASALFENKGVVTKFKTGQMKVSAKFEKTADIDKELYNSIIKDVESDSIAKLTFNGDKVEVEYKKAMSKIIEAPGKSFLENETVNAQIKSGKLKVSTPAPETVPWFVSIIPTVIMFLLIIGFWMFVMRQSQGGKGMGSFGKSKAKSPDENGKRVTFADVAGVEEEKKELSEIVDFLRDPRKFTDLGARIPKGVLLVGPPGTGKTLLAKAVAGEAGVPFFSMSGSDFVEMFVGVGASRVRDLFEQARKNLPAIIFIDEIDAVGRQRGTGLGGGHDEREQTLNQLLVEMDGFGTNSGIIIIAATNRADILDPALLRPGRFDRQVVVNYPDQKGREAILEIHAKNKPLDESVSLEKVAKSTYGFTGADLENILNEAAILAAREKKDKIGQSEMDEAILKVVMGPEKKNKVMKAKDKEQTAYHEAGHAILSHILPTQDSVHQVSIIPRGAAGGFTLSLPDMDKMYVSKDEMLEYIIVTMGGRVAEKIIYDHINTGASSDIDHATKTARNMVMRYGMSEKLGFMNFEGSDHEVFLGRDFSQGNNYSPETAAVIDKEIKAIIDSCYTRCEELLRENLDKLHSVAKALIAYEKLDGEEFVKAFEGTLEIESKNEETKEADAQ